MRVDLSIQLLRYNKSKKHPFGLGNSFALFFVNLKMLKLNYMNKMHFYHIKPTLEEEVDDHNPGFGCNLNSILVEDVSRGSSGKYQEVGSSRGLNNDFRKLLAGSFDCNQSVSLKIYFQIYVEFSKIKYFHIK